MQQTRDLGEIAQELKSCRELLEGVEFGVLSGIASTLAMAASELSETVERLQRMRPKEWMTPEEAARYLGKSKTALWEMCSKEKIPRHYLTPRVVYFNREELDEWLMSR